MGKKEEDNKPIQGEPQEGEAQDFGWFRRFNMLRRAVQAEDCEDLCKWKEEKERKSKDRREYNMRHMTSALARWNLLQDKKRWLGQLEKREKREAKLSAPEKIELKEKTQKELDEEEYQEEQRIRAEEKELERKECNIRKRKRITWTKEELRAMARQRPIPGTLRCKRWLEGARDMRILEWDRDEDRKKEEEEKKKKAEEAK